MSLPPHSLATSPPTFLNMPLGPCPKECKCIQDQMASCTTSQDSAAVKDVLVEKSSFILLAVQGQSCEGVNLPKPCHNSYISSLFNFHDLTQEHIEVKRVDLVYFVCFHCQHV